MRAMKTSVFSGIPVLQGAASILESSASFPFPLIPSIPSTHFSTIPDKGPIIIQNLNFGEAGDEARAENPQQNHPPTVMDPSREKLGVTLFKKLNLGDIDDVKRAEETAEPGPPVKDAGENFNPSPFPFPLIPSIPSTHFSTIPNKGPIIHPPTVMDPSRENLADTLFKKLNLGGIGNVKRVEEAHTNTPRKFDGNEATDEIFKKMKETGLIPNAVAMIDGLCKDGLVQEAMKLFVLMREKGTVPEVVIYTAVVEGFCKGGRFDDAKRIFRKMQKNGVAANAYTFAVLIHGLCNGGRLEDSVEFFREMLDAGHSPNLATFVGMVDRFCKEKGLEEAENVVRGLRERGFGVDEKAIREHLRKKGSASRMVWDAIFGKKTSRRPF